MKPLVSVRGLLLYAAWHDLRVETGDLVRVHATCERSREGRMDLATARSDERHANGMRTASRDFTEFLADVLTECMGFTRRKLKRCLFEHESIQTRVVSHVDDPLTCAKLVTLDRILDTHCKVGCYQERRGTQFSHTCGVLGVRIEYCSVQGSQRGGFAVRTAKYVDECLDLVHLQNCNAKPVVTPLTEQKSLNLHEEKTRATKFNTHYSELLW